MDEEGTVVYFETSPAVEGLQQEGGDVQEFVFSEQQPLEAQEKDDKQSAGESIKSVFWKKILSIWIGHTQVEQDAYTERVITTLRESPLLTEEDFQLLYFTLPESSQILKKEDTYQNKTATPSLWRGNWNRLVLISSIYFAVIACGLVVNRAVFFGCGAGLLAITAGVALAKWIKFQYQQQLEDGVKALSLYTSEMETLLALLTQAIRTIQETEIISHGYSRPARTVPISRVEKQASSYQCLVLRRRVFRVCQQGTVLLRKRTQLLHEKYPLNEELDSVHSYLAFSPLEQLHPYLLDEQSEMKETDCATADLPSLSLESLKDASNLMAVQNSELFRRLALNLGRVRLKASGSEKLNLPKLPGVLAEAQHFASGACTQLKWSLEFHKNRLFGEPPTRNLLKLAGESPILQPVLDEVHCMDLKTQNTLQRIREVGLILVKLSSSTEAELVRNSTAESIREQLLSIQHDTEDIASHVTDGVLFLNKLLQPEGNQMEPHGVSTTHDIASTELQQDDQDEESSDEDMVFEAYIPPLAADSVMDRDNSQLTKEEREEMERHLREAKQVPRRMMKELQSVLAIRSVQKEKRKEERRRRKKKHQLPYSSIDGAKLLSDSHPTSPLISEPDHGVKDISEKVPVVSDSVQSEFSDAEKLDVTLSETNDLKIHHQTVTVSANPSVTSLDVTQASNSHRSISVAGQSVTSTASFESCQIPDDSHVDAEMTHSQGPACIVSGGETACISNATLNSVEGPPAPPMMRSGAGSLQLAQAAVAAALLSSRVKAEEVFEDSDEETPCDFKLEES